MISLSAAILLATCTATFGLHSSSSTTSSYSYFAFASALRSLPASSAELRPPIPLTETPPVNGPMKPTLTLSLACAVASGAAAQNKPARIKLSGLTIPDIGTSLVDRSLYPILIHFRSGMFAIASGSPAAICVHASPQALSGACLSDGNCPGFTIRTNREGREKDRQQGCNGAPQEIGEPLRSMPERFQVGAGIVDGIERHWNTTTGNVVSDLPTAHHDGSR